MHARVISHGTSRGSAVMDGSARSTDRHHAHVDSCDAKSAVIEFERSATSASHSLANFDELSDYPHDLPSSVKIRRSKCEPH